ncbi:Protein csh3 [Psilocybe cubensis]|uniref:Protein csh3 n=2 Tax=Psilocybe cubensis TaxID=181762 RepID=A0ACB8H512_PSICU|nr:Protein csh3 [Psilocybe cubensis]KAH9483093.1 Protein csh3 [Psilocybe cubensis]
MVFSNLQPHEKEAFFSLLDEYFSARPEIFANAAHSDAPPSTNTPQGAAVSAVGRAMASNPEATAKFMSAGLKQISSARSSGTSAGGPSSSAYASAGAGDSDNEGQAVTSVAGRVAAFANARNNQPTPSSASSSQIAEKPSSASSLVSVKKFGNSVDMSSGKGFIGSLRSKPASPPQVAVPPAFAPRQNNFAPPPRRTSSSTSTPTPDPAAATPPPPPAPRFQQPKYEEPEPEPEVHGEWAEALYDYNSGEAGDLVVSEGDRILVVERTSDDWWTGEVNGKKGLFPASYVKLL